MFDDSLLEGDEKFEIGLVWNFLGIVIGNYLIFIVVICVNDDVYGVFNFMWLLLSKIILEFGIGFISEVEFEIVWSVDLYGIVVVFWEVFNGFVDLFLVSGNVMFVDGVM